MSIEAIGNATPMHGLLYWQRYSRMERTVSNRDGPDAISKVSDTKEATDRHASAGAVPAQRTEDIPRLLADGTLQITRMRGDETLSKTEVTRHGVHVNQADAKPNHYMKAYAAGSEMAAGSFLSIFI